MRNAEEYSRGLRRAVLAEDNEAAETLSLYYQKALRTQGVDPVEAASLANQELSRAIEARERGVVGNLMKGLGTGVVGLGESAALGLAALAEEEDEIRYREAIQKAATAIRPDNVNEESIVSNFGSALGSTVPLIPLAALGPAGIGAAGGIGALAGAGEASERARASNATEEERNEAALKGLALGTSEVFVPAKLGKMISKLRGKLDDDVAQFATNKLARAKRIGGTAAQEAVQEATVAVGQNLIERGYNLEQEVIDAAVGEDGAYGGAVGATLQGVLELFIPGKNRARTAVTTDPTNDIAEGEEPNIPDSEISGPAAEVDRTEVTPEMLRAADELDSTETGINPIASSDSTLPPVFDGDALADAGVEAPLTLDTEMFDQQQQRDLDELDRLTDPNRPMDFPDFRRGRPASEQRQGISSLPSNREQATRDNELFNRTLGRVQPDMFEAERIQGTGDQALGPMQERQRLEQFWDTVEQDNVQQRTVQLESQPQQQADMFSPEEVSRREQEAQAEQQEQEAQAEQQAIEASRFSQQVVEGSQQQQSQQRRDKIIEDTISQAPPTINPQRLSALVQRAFQNEGLRDTELTEQEAEKINRATGMVKALKDKEAEVQAERQAAEQERQEIQNAEISAPTQSTRSGGTPQTVGVSALKNRARKAVSALPQTKEWAQMSPTEKKALETEVAQTIATATPDMSYASRVRLFMDEMGRRGKAGARVSASMQKTLKGDTTPAPKKVPTKKPAKPKVAEKPSPKKAEPKKETPVQMAERLYKEAVGAGKKGTAEAKKLKANLDKMKAKPKKVEPVEVVSDENVSARPQTEPNQRVISEEVAADLENLDVDEQTEKVLAELDKSDKKDSLVVSVTDKANTDENIFGADGRPKDGKPRDAKGNVLSEAEAKRRAGNIAKTGIDTIRAIPKFRRLNLTDAEIEELLGNNYELPSEDVIASAQNVPFGVRATLVQNKLEDAMNRLAKTAPTARLRRLSKALANKAGDTQVMVMRNLTASDGRPVAGYFDPSNNTIYLDSVDGMNTHTVLHEMVHAVTSDSLSRKGSPTTRQFQKLFEVAKDVLPTAYGTKNVDEFVAEAMSNPKFQKMLATVRVSGQKVPAFRLFLNNVMNVIRRVMGMQPRNIESTLLNEADKLFMSIAHPAPVSRPAAELLMEVTQNNLSAIKSKFTEMQESRPEIELGTPRHKKFVQNTVEFLKQAPEKARGLGMALLHLQTVGDIAKKADLGDLGLNVLRTINEQRGAMNSMDKSLKKTLSEVKSLYDSLSDAQRKALNTVVYDPEIGATIVQIDPAIVEAAESPVPSTKRAEARAKLSEYKLDPEKEAALDSVMANWDVLDADAKKIYKEIQETYSEMYEELIAVAGQRIEGSVDANADSAEAKQNRKNLYEKMLSNSKLEVYFPLVREGEYTLRYQYKDEQGNYQLAVEQFQTAGERERAKQIIKNKLDLKVENEKAGGLDKYFLTGNRSLQNYDRNNIPASSFVGSVLNTLTANNVDSGVINDILNMFIESLPESSFAKSLKGRQGTPGYIQDVNYAFNNKAFSLGNQIVRLQYSDELGKISAKLSRVAEEAASNKDNPENDTLRSQVVSELQSRINFARNGAKDKTTENAVRVANQTAFNWTIGLNAASAIVNLSQVPLVMYPILGGEHGFANADKEIRSAMGLVFGSSRYAEVNSKAEKALEKASIASGLDQYFDVTYYRGKEREPYHPDDNPTGKGRDFDISFKKGVPQEVRERLEGAELVIKRAMEQGLLDTSYMLEALGLNEVQKRGRGGAMGALDSLTNVMAGMFNQAERFNRQTAMLAAYNLELKKLQGDKRKPTQEMKNKAADRAIYLSQELNGGVTVETGSRFGQEGIARMAMMYKSYGIAMYTMMFKRAKQALKDIKDKELRSVAVRQLVAIHGSAIFFSGVYGLPIYGTMAMLYDFFLADDDEEEFSSVVEATLGTGLFRGGLNPALELLGLDIDAGVRMRLTDLLFQDTRFNPNRSPEQTFGEYVGGVPLSVLSKVSRGLGDLSEGNFMRGLEGVMPTAISNALKPFRFAAEDGIRTRRYDLIVDDLTWGEIAGQIIGFGPERNIRAQEENRRLKNLDEGINKKITKATRKYYLAYRLNDWDTMDEVMEEIVEFNKKHPRFAISFGRLRRSYKRHIDTTAEMVNGISLSKPSREVVSMFNGNTRGILLDI